MTTLILLAAAPLAISAAVMAWHGYEASLTGTSVRALQGMQDVASTLRQETNGTRNWLQAASTAPFDADGLRRLLLVSESVTDIRFCHVTVVSAQGSSLVDVSDAGQAECPTDPTIFARVSEPQSTLSAHDPQSTIGIFKGRAFVQVALFAPQTDGPWRGARVIATSALLRHADAMGGETLLRGNRARSDGVQAWLIAPDGQMAFIGVGRDGVGTTPEEFEAIHGILGRNTVGEQSSADSPKLITSGDRVFALASIGAGLRIATITDRSASEVQGSALFTLQVVAIILLMVCGLIGVKISADFLLVEPVEQLIRAVGSWHQGGVFDTRVTRSMPVELRHLAYAFLRATRRLLRHEDRLSRAMERQSLLMREIHHRVKNNLQIVASLLNLQANRIRSPESRAEFMEARHRVRALATLHRYLYSHMDLSAHDMENFLRELGGQILAASGNLEAGSVTLVVNAEEIPIPSDNAVPLALIVTELVSNAMKYAFRDQENGRIEIGLRRDALGNAVLTISDNGIGQPEGDIMQRTGLGMHLVRGFVRQIGATLEIGGEVGIIYTITFPLNRSVEREELHLT